MSKELFISSTPHETKVAITEEDQLTEIYFERENEYTLAGSIYKGKVTRVLPGMQSAFVDIGLERDAFLYVTDFLEQQEEDDIDLSKEPGQQQRREGGREQRQESRNEERRHDDRRNDRREQRADQPAAQQNGATEAESGEEGEREPGSAPSGEREGARRWRGRRRRGRRGGHGEQRGAEPQQPAAAHEEQEFVGGEDEALEPMPGESLARFGEGEEPASQSYEQSGGDVLPGESISRYRGQREEQPQRESRRSFEPRDAEQQPEAAPQQQSTHFERPSQINSPGPVTWAGDVLPGESIAKYRGEGAAGTSSEETRTEASSEPGDRDRGRGRFDRDRGRGGRDRGRGGRFDRDRGRGGRDRDRDRDRGPRESYSAPEAPISGPEIFALPGESISKYRGVTAEAPHTHETAVSDAAPANTPRANAPEMMSSIHEHQPQSRGAVLDESSSAKQDFEEQSYSRESGPAGRFAEPSSAFERSDRAQHAPSHDSSQSMEPTGSGDMHFEEQEEEEVSPAASSQQQAADERLFAPGAGVVEEEEIEEEESEMPMGERLDLDAYEDLEEETLDAENAEQLVDAVRDAHVRRRLEQTEPNGHAEEGEQHFEVADIADAETEIIEEGEEAEGESNESGFESEELGAVEEALDEEEGDEEDEENADRAELRAPAGTAAFQQRNASPDRERSRDRFRRGGRRGRPMRRGGPRRNIQREDQPKINELLKEGQEILVQIAKEPIAKKGARITSHIALPGRFLVFMPTVNHVGVSRKIGSDEERYRLKRILVSEKGDAHGGFIVRTAAAGASEEDLRADLRFLINLWNDIKTRTETSKSPALIYHDLNLVERILRDQVTGTFTSIWSDSEQEYERIVRFLSRFQPSLVKRVKLYTKETPLFEQFGINDEINKALKSKVWLKNGGYIVINQTEALVAIDINTGKYVGKTTRLEDTIVKTNLDAIPEIVRQIRLRDLGGIIVIDFIDMDERKNRQKVMQALEDALKADRAPSKVLQFNDFGLVAITRKRVKQSLERTLSTQCNYCTGTGMVKSTQTVCNEIYVEMRKMHRQIERHDILLRVNPEVVKGLKANGGKWLIEMEELTKKTIIVKSDPLLHQEQFDIQ